MKFKKTPAILIATHGGACEEMVRAAEMLYGSVENIHALALLPGMHPDEFRGKMEALVQQYDGDIIILVDMAGGTPFNTLLQMSRERELCAVAGVNIPMVTEAIDMRDGAEDADQLAAGLAEVARDAVSDITPTLHKFYGMGAAQR